MGKFIGVFACLVIVALDIIGGFLGLEQKLPKMRLWIFECKEPSHDAFVLGLAAATLLGIAHVLANLLGGCSVCTQEELEKASPSKQLSMACLIFTCYSSYVELDLSLKIWKITSKFLRYTS
ncbi:UNVERIFIED_CONTAM: hypothetical protein Sradi_6111400 [Sesamum radiatum]|uniref:Uncharacterized protein n=1 Tax=Sesamum radiatum TaxID=300843 RepID=A0AAW2KLT9_SESRA